MNLIISPIDDQIKRSAAEQRVATDSWYGRSKDSSSEYLFLQVSAYTYYQWTEIVGSMITATGTPHCQKFILKQLKKLITGKHPGYKLCAFDDLTLQQATLYQQTSAGFYYLLRKMTDEEQWACSQMSDDNPTNPRWELELPLTEMLAQLPADKLLPL